MASRSPQGHPELEDEFPTTQTGRVRQGQEGFWPASSLASSSGPLPDALRALTDAIKCAWGPGWGMHPTGPLSLELPAHRGHFMVGECTGGPTEGGSSPGRSGVEDRQSRRFHRRAVCSQRRGWARAGSVHRDTPGPQRRDCKRPRRGAPAFLCLSGELPEPGALDAFSAPSA